MEAEMIIRGGVIRSSISRQRAGKRFGIDADIDPQRKRAEICNLTVPKLREITFQGRSKGWRAARMSSEYLAS